MSIPLRLFTALLTVGSVFLNFFTPERPEQRIQTTDLDVPISEISRVEFGLHISSFTNQDTEYKLEVKNGQLTDGKITAPTSVIRPLLSGLRGLYPGTRSLSWQAWTDDYPLAWVYLYLNDGTIINISSTSQYEGMAPWNVTSWSSEEAALPDAVYVQLNESMVEGVDALWRGVSEQGFPRKQDNSGFWESAMENSVSEYVQFTPNLDDINSTPVNGKRSGLYDSFLPALRGNSEIQKLLQAGYTIYDASLAIEAKPENKGFKPIRYNGMLALATPDGGDAVAGMVEIPFDSGQAVTTTLRADDVEQRVQKRRSSSFLTRAGEMFPSLTFILDTRDGVFRPELNCDEDPSILSKEQVVKAIWQAEDEPRWLHFYPLSNDRWTVDFDLRREDPRWSDGLAEKILKAWFPSGLASTPVDLLQEVKTNFTIAFQPDITYTHPELLDHMKKYLPAQMKEHLQNPEKAGDYSFLSLDGRVVISESGTEPVIVNCGISKPDYYGDPYPIESVVVPQEQAPLENNGAAETTNGEWHTLGGAFLSGQKENNGSSIAFSQPGHLHILWTERDRGVFYTDGFINGTVFNLPQRLGDAAYWVYVQAWPDGEVHLFWDAGSNTGGVMHVWRPAGGNWQKSEHWSDMHPFFDVLRDSHGVIHLGYDGSDGLDSEYMHRTWTPENGLSAPENISRRIGSTGNTDTVLRLDAKGRLHAAWTHILEEKSYRDPLTGETADLSGVFYAHRLDNGHWSQPEQVGISAAYAHVLGMELTPQGEPLLLWQADQGLVSRVKKDGNWQPEVELAEVKPPSTPAEFGPERWVTASLALQTGVNSQGEVIASWLIPQVGLKMTSWNGNEWSDTTDIVSAGEAQQILDSPETLKMVIDKQDRVHFVFFMGKGLVYRVYDRQKIEAHAFSTTYEGYGIDDASLDVDEIGSVAVLALPRSPDYYAKAPEEGIPATLTPTPILTVTPMPSAAPTRIPDCLSSEVAPKSDLLWKLAGMVILAGFFIWALTNYRKI